MSPWTGARQASFWEGSLIRGPLNIIRRAFPKIHTPVTPLKIWIQCLEEGLGHVSLDKPLKPSDSGLHPRPKSTAMKDWSLEAICCNLRCYHCSGGCEWSRRVGLIELFTGKVNDFSHISVMGSSSICMNLCAKRREFSDPV